MPKTRLTCDLAGIRIAELFRLPEWKKPRRFQAMIAAVQAVVAERGKGEK